MVSVLGCAELFVRCKWFAVDSIGWLRNNSIELMQASGVAQASGVVKEFLTGWGGVC